MLPILLSLPANATATHVSQRNSEGYPLMYRGTELAPPAVVLEEVT